MRESEDVEDRQPKASQTNWTTVILLAALLLLLLLFVFFATRGNPDQDKLTNEAVVTTSRTAPAGRDKLCASGATYDLIKRELFRRAAQLRGSDEPAFDRLAAAAVIRMENPVMESEDNTTGAVNCSGSVAVDLPPGVAVVGGRHSLGSDIDYTVTSAADGSGPVVLLKNADAIVTPLATVGEVSQPAPAQAQPPAADNAVAPEAHPAIPQPTPQAPPPTAPPRPTTAVPSRPAAARPSFDCSAARRPGEIAVCRDPGLAALDRQMAQQYSRAYDDASPAERDMLRETAHRFYAYRDHCTTDACISEAYSGRMREIGDIMEGRWRPSR